MTILVNIKHTVMILNVIWFIFGNFWVFLDKSSCEKTVPTVHR